MNAANFGGVEFKLVARMASGLQIYKYKYKYDGFVISPEWIIVTPEYKAVYVINESFKRVLDYALQI